MAWRRKGVKQNTVTGEPFDKQISVKLYSSEHELWTKTAADRNISLNEMIRVTMRKECLYEKPKEECKHLRILDPEFDLGSKGRTAYICKLCGEKL